jgi:hypothetical protein
VGNNPINLVDPNGLCAVVANNGFVHPAEVEYSIASDSNIHLTPFNSGNSSPQLNFDFRGLSSNCTENHAKAVSLTGYSF